MKIKVTYERPAGVVDLILTADADATVGDVADALITRDPAGAGHVAGAGTLTLIESGRVSLAPETALVGSGLVSGARIGVSPASAHSGQAARPVATITVLDGPDRGQRVSLAAGNRTIGRSGDCDVRLSDSLVSRRHARIFLEPGSAEILDLGSANGLDLNGDRLARGAWMAGDRLEVGDSVLGIEFTTHAAATARDAATAFNRPPVVAAGYEGAALACPDLPEEQQPQRFPLLSMLAPFLLGAVLYAVTRSLYSLVFVALSPMMMLTNLIEGRWTAARGRRAALATFRQELTDLDACAREARAQEVHGRDAGHPATAECLAAAERRSPLLWSRRPGGPGFLEVRAGAATLPSLVRFDVSRAAHGRAIPGTRSDLDDLIRGYRSVDGVPAVLSLTASGSVGIAGPPDSAADVTRAVLCQIAALHSPAEVVLAAFCGARSRPDWEWLKWLPHVTSPHSPLAGPHLVAGAESALLLGQLEDLVRERTGREPGLPGAVTIVVLIDSETTAERARLVELSKTGPAAGIHCVWLAPRAEGLPAACVAYLAVRADRTATLGDSTSGTFVTGIAADAVDSRSAMAFSRSISPLADAGAVLNDDSDLPRAVSWLELHDLRLADDPGAVIEQWRLSQSVLTGPEAPPPGPRRPGTLRALVGQAAGQPHALDLRADGPHALLGGTTGAGKSELLQSWILSMAAAHSPQRVTFLLVDYKGGSAFSDCQHLPHTVGLVTDLSPHLVKRALQSLRAELVYRELLFKEKNVKDLIELEKTGDPDAPPSLVIVVDEFKALVDEVPDFFDGVVNVAQKGRSLGLHLVLATQRPTGVIKESLRANTNLRLALRMADETDSTDVLGTADAAHIAIELPGRAVSKTGPGRLVPFQSAYVGGWTLLGQRRPDVRISELIVGEGREWTAPEPAVPAQRPDAGQTDSARVTATIREASQLAKIPPPRRPWLDELRPLYDLRWLRHGGHDDVLAFGMVDDPRRQQQLVAVFDPDDNGNLAVFGTGGTGKSTVLRTLAVRSAGGAASQVYGLDFGSRGLEMLGLLPHVGAIVPGDEHDRVTRLLRTLAAAADDRARRYSEARARTITEYRRNAGQPHEPRILLLLDGFGVFRQQYEALDGGKWFEAFIRLAAEGSPLGIHVILTADRPTALPARLNSAIQRRLILRLADDNEYALAGVDRGVLTPESPPGRGLMSGLEVQVAVFGGSSDVAVQAKSIEDLAEMMRGRQVPPAPPIERLPDLVRLTTLPELAGDRPVIGVADHDLMSVGFRPNGVFLISGPHGSGRTTAIGALVTAIARTSPQTARVFFGGRNSPLTQLGVWQQVCTDPAEIAEAAAKLEERINHEDVPARGYAVVIEGLADYVSPPTEAPLTALVKTLVSHGQLVIAEGETSTLTQGWSNLAKAVRSARSGLALQPEQSEGQSLYMTDFPRIRRSEFPPGRGLLIEAGRVNLVQIAIPE